MSEEWMGHLDRLARAFKRHEFTVREFMALAIELMPIGGAAELVARLPDDVIASMRTLLAESAAYTEETWELLINLNGPQLTPEDRREYRQKLNELRPYFTS